MQHFFCDPVRAKLAREAAEIRETWAAVGRGRGHEGGPLVPLIRPFLRTPAECLSCARPSANSEEYLDDASKDLGQSPGSGQAKQGTKHQLTRLGVSVRWEPGAPHPSQPTKGSENTVSAPYTWHHPSPALCTPTLPPCVHPSLSEASPLGGRGPCLSMVSWSRILRSGVSWPEWQFLGAL